MWYRYSSVRFDEVQVGDRVYDSLYYAPDKWREVTEVELFGSVTAVVLSLGTTAHDTIDTRTKIFGRPYEQLCVKREED